MLDLSPLGLVEAPFSLLNTNNLERLISEAKKSIPAQ